MRLTLRTLLAWLDDTLPPAEVREIGHQVAESPFAKELVERIHRVTRQRRLSVPNSTGQDAIDPNAVAAYLDNELSPELVAEYEKLCLTSDVHLAEVASTHQILSLIGQKAKVPPEAKYRMYRLIKGRETVGAAPRTARTAPAPLTEPLPPWVPPEPARRSWVEQYGPFAAVAALILLLAWSAWMSLPRRELRQSVGSVAVATPREKAEGPTTPPQAQEDGARGQADHAKADAATGRPEVAEAKTKEAPKRDEAPKDAPPGDKANADELPPGVVGVVGKEAADQVLLRFDPDARHWERLKAEAPLKSDAFLVSLAPFRTPVRLEPATVDLVGETAVRVRPADARSDAQLDLIRGRLVIHAAAPPAPVGVRFAGATLKITPPEGAPVGLERLVRREPGSATPSAVALRVYAAQGDVALAVGEATMTLKGPGSITFEPPDRFADTKQEDPPAWVTDAAPTAADKELAEQFAKFFAPNKRVMVAIIEAMDDQQQPDMRRLAVSALGDIALGDLLDMEQVVSALGRQDDPIVRRAAIRALRGLLSLGPEAARGVDVAIRQALGDEDAAVVRKLLVGFTPREAREESTYAALIGQLKSPDVGIRELALENLRALTGRDDLGYDPDKPEGKGLDAWQGLLKQNDLRPKANATPKGR
jgi:hypothetical protein